MMPYADTAAMQVFLDRFCETIKEDEHAVMILDQAGWHGSNALAVPGSGTKVTLAGLLARAESRRARLALSQGTLPLAPPARRLPGHRRGRLHGLE